MRASRFTLRTLLGVILLCSLALGSFVHLGRGWVPALLFTLLVGMLLLSIPASIFAGGRDRAFHVGFATVGGAYLWLALSSGTEHTVGRLTLALPVAEAICLATTNSLGDLPHFLHATHSLFALVFAWLGGLTGLSYYRRYDPTASASRPEEIRSAKQPRRGWNYLPMRNAQ